MLTARNDQVICEPMFPPDMSPGGIIIPDQARSRINQGIVKYIGPKVTTVKPGDHVIFTGYAGTLIKLEDEGLVLIMPENYINAIIEEEDYEVPGVYFKSADGDYFPALYSHIIHLMTLAASETDWYRSRKFREYKPSVAELYAKEE